MAGTTTLAGLKRFFTFPFEETDWQKHFVIGAALLMVASFVPLIPMIFVCGYLVQVMRQVIAGKDLTLPPWEEWGKLGLDGLRYGIVNLVYLLPGVLIFSGGIAIYMLAALIFPLSMQTADPGANLTFLPLLFVGSMIVMLVSTCLGTLLILLGAVPLPMAVAHFVATDQVAAAFRFHEWWNLLRRNKMGYLVAWVVVGGMLAILYVGTMLLYAIPILCILIPLLSAPLLFYAMLVQAAVFGETYRESVFMVGQE